MSVLAAISMSADLYLFPASLFSPACISGSPAKRKLRFEDTTITWHNAVTGIKAGGSSSVAYVPCGKSVILSYCCSNHPHAFCVRSHIWNHEVIGELEDITTKNSTHPTEYVVPHHLPVLRVPIQYTRDEFTLPAFYSLTPYGETVKITGSGV